MIGLIENAILARLQAASTSGALGYRLREIDSLPIDIDKRLVERVVQYPAAWTVFGGWRPLSQHGRVGARVQATFTVVVAAENLRNERASRQGGSESEVGSYQLMTDAVALLMGQDLGLAIGALVLGAAKSLYTPDQERLRKLSLFAVDFTTDFLLSPGADLGAPAIGDFETFNASWDLPPHGAIDAVSNVTLPIQEPAP